VSEAMKEPGGTSLRRFKPYPAYEDFGVEWMGENRAHGRSGRRAFVHCLCPSSTVQRSRLTHCRTSWRLPLTTSRQLFFCPLPPSGVAWRFAHSA